MMVVHHTFYCDYLGKKALLLAHDIGMYFKENMMQDEARKPPKSSFGVEVFVQKTKLKPNGPVYPSRFNWFSRLLRKTEDGFYHINSLCPLTGSLRPRMS